MPGPYKMVSVVMFRRGFRSARTPYTCRGEACLARLDRNISSRLNAIPATLNARTERDNPRAIAHLHAMTAGLEHDSAKSAETS